jgi:hypothetical protein
MTKMAPGVKEGLNTNLISKDYSPMIVRKYNIVNGWPVYVGIICDWSLSNLDSVVNEAVDAFEGRNLNDIQEVRNLAGYLSDYIKNHYNTKKKNCVEGIGIAMYVDKCFISSLYGDFMNHLSCRMEFYQILNILPHI